MLYSVPSNNFLRLWDIVDCPGSISLPNSPKRVLHKELKKELEVFYELDLEEERVVIERLMYDTLENTFDPIDWILCFHELSKLQISYSLLQSLYDDFFYSLLENKYYFEWEELGLFLRTLLLIECPLQQLPKELVKQIYQHLEKQVSGKSTAHWVVELMRKMKFFKKDYRPFYDGSLLRIANGDCTSSFETECLDIIESFLKHQKPSIVLERKYSVDNLMIADASFVYKDRRIIVEIDGPRHFKGKKPNHTTWLRNKFYQEMGFHLVNIRSCDLNPHQSIADQKEYILQKMIDVLDKVEKSDKKSMRRSRSV